MPTEVPSGGKEYLSTQVLLQCPGSPPTSPGSSEIPCNRNAESQNVPYRAEGGRIWRVFALKVRVQCMLKTESNLKLISVILGISLKVHN